MILGLKGASRLVLGGSDADLGKKYINGTDGPLGRFKHEPFLRLI